MLGELPRPVVHDTPQPCPWGHVKADGIATGVLLGAGGILIATSDTTPNSWTGLPHDAGRLAIASGLFAVAAMTLISGVHGIGIANRCEEQNERLAEQQRAREALYARREQAWSLTREAADAARAGDCGRVTALDAQVTAVDADFRATVFARDVAIARCIAGAAR